MLGHQKGHQVRNPHTDGKETRAFSLGGRFDQVSLLPFLTALLNYVRRIFTEVLKGFGNKAPLEFVWDQHHKTQVFMT